jgi:preprotein translocase subunit SecG
LRGLGFREPLLELPDRVGVAIVLRQAAPRVILAQFSEGQHGDVFSRIWHFLQFGTKTVLYSTFVMMYLVTAIHVVVCFILIGVVLLQSGKAADLAGAFGGMGSQTTFGPRGTATVLSKATTVAAIVFMVTALTLFIMENRGTARTGSVLEGMHAGKTVPQKTVPKRVPGPAPTAPAAPTTGTPKK